MFRQQEARRRRRVQAMRSSAKKNTGDARRRPARTPVAEFHQRPAREAQVGVTSSEASSPLLPLPASSIVYYLCIALYPQATALDANPVLKARLCCLSSTSPALLHRA